MQVAEKAKERLSGLNSQNELLHSHLQTLTQRLEELEQKREAEAASSAQDHLEAPSTSGDSECLASCMFMCSCKLAW